MRIIDGLPLLESPGAPDLDRDGLGGRAAPVGGRRESVLGGSATASLLSTPPNEMSTIPRPRLSKRLVSPEKATDRLVS